MLMTAALMAEEVVLAIHMSFYKLMMSELTTHSLIQYTTPFEGALERLPKVSFGWVYAGLRRCQ
jgi:hypothetical protein